MRVLCFLCICLAGNLACTPPAHMQARINGKRWVATPVAISRKDQCQLTHIVLGGASVNGTGAILETMAADHHQAYRVQFNIYDIPLRRGRYALKEKDSCSTESAGKGQLIMLRSDSTIIGSFQYKEEDRGWVAVDRYEARSGHLRGRFALRLSQAGPNQTTKTIRIRKGRFRTRVW